MRYPFITTAVIKAQLFVWVISVLSGCTWPCVSYKLVDAQLTPPNVAVSPGTNIRRQLNLAYVDAIGESDPRHLDLYLPLNSAKPFPLIVWFHGGGLTGGSKNNSLDQSVAERWAKRGVGVINVDYRLSPEAHFPNYIEDAAQSVAWAVREIRSLGADPQAIYVGGYSAGGYLAAMLAMDERYLRAVGVGPQQLAGFISLSGQMTTHFNVRKARGLSDLPVIVDDAAPSYYVRADIPRLLLLIGDNDWPARLEENQLLAAQLSQVAKSKNVHFQIIPNRTHASIFEHLFEPDDTAGEAMWRFMQAPYLK